MTKNQTRGVAEMMSQLESTPERTCARYQSAWVTKGAEVVIATTSTRPGKRV